MMVLLWPLLGLGCGSEDPCAGTRDLGLSPAGLTLTAQEHPGWDQQECFTCHQTWNIHQQDCMGGIDVDEVQERTDVQDTTSCVACHGANEDTGA